MTTSPALRNVAIIAHVDHGKTTLIDGLLRETGTFAAHEEVVERVMDSMELERERGITIRAKNASMSYQGVKINIVDTPGHADFGGEVERTLMMVEGVLLLVDAAEGPLPQTRFVLQKALALHLQPIVIINKIDRKDARIEEVRNEIYDLFIDLGADEHQIEFPIIYASSRERRAGLNLAEIRDDLKIILDTVIRVIHPPKVEEGALKMLVCNIGYSPYLGALGTGKIYSGSITTGQQVIAIQEGNKQVPFKVMALKTHEGLSEAEAETLLCGDIAVVAGLPGIDIGDTICSPEDPSALPRIEVDPPTVSMHFSVNTSPLAGKDGKYLTSRKLHERLLEEARSNVAIKVLETETAGVFEVKGRGELQLCIIAEQMRREGSEFMVSRPHVLTREINGQTMEPTERVVVDIPDTSMGVVTDTLSRRKGVLQRVHNLSSGRVRLEFLIPSRGLIGYRSTFLTDTRGEGLISSFFAGYAPQTGSMFTRPNGALVSDRAGLTSAYALSGLESRGKLFVRPGLEIYEGSIVGEHCLLNDLNVNAVREKKLTNMRAAGKDDNIVLTPVQEPDLDEAVAWLDDDEWVEVTPRFLRLRKSQLSANQRSLIRR